MSVDDFTLHFGVTPQTVPGCKLIHMLDESGNFEKKLLGVVVTPQGLPDSLPRRKRTLYCDISNVGSLAWHAVRPCSTASCAQKCQICCFVNLSG